MFEAEHIATEARVALKLLLPHVVQMTSARRRFELEAKVAARVNSEHIVKVFDAGVTESGRPFFVMELIRGVKITDYCDQNSLTTAERLGLFVQVCQAVQHAHQKGIIHRDIKPSNVLVTTTEQGVALPVVIDFGVAKATTNLRLTDKTLFTAFEMLIGTPAYMSPEQVRGRGVDKRCDIWAFGCVLYEMLTGRPAFARETLADVIGAILTDEPDWAPLPIGTPAALRHLLQLCLTKDLRRRLRDIGDARLDGTASVVVPVAVSDVAPRAVNPFTL